MPFGDLSPRKRNHLQVRSNRPRTTFNQDEEERYRNSAESTGVDHSSSIAALNLAVSVLQGDIAGLAARQLVFVSKKSEFPAAVSGVITLVDNYTYFITVEVDLAGDRIVCAKNTAIIGGSAENSRIISTGLTGTALITSLYSLTLHSVSFTADVALDLDGVIGGQALNWTLVNFLDCPTIGTVKNYTNFIGTTIGVLGSANWTFDGTIDTVGFSGSIFAGIAGQTTVILPSTLTITRRFRAIYSAFVAFGGATALDVSATAVIPNSAYILDTCSFSGGATYTAGVQYNDNKALFINNVGIDNSSSVSNYYMIGNATATTITTINTPVKAAGTTMSDAITQRFTNTTNRATYTGAIKHNFKVSAHATLISENNVQMALYIAFNGVVVPQSLSVVTGGSGGRANSTSAQAIASAGDTDYFEVWVENESGTQNITVENLNVIVEVI